MSSSALAAGLRQLRGKLAAQQQSSDSDEQLLHAFTSRRDDSAFAVLVRRHGPMVLHVCRRVLGHEQDAEDAFQSTFLVLAQSAASLRNKTSLASFLHGTAYRTAMKAKQSAARRHKHEGQTPARPQTDPADELSWREVRTLLDEEISRLPEKYRVVFVLFYLEDHSREETARRLGLNDAAVAKRLAEARKRLGRRLARRGVELTAALSALALAQQSASALPAGLTAITVKAALATAAGEGLAGIVSASVAQLVKSATTAMVVSKAKIATVLLLTASMMAGASVWAYRGLAANALAPSTQPAEPPAAKADDTPKAPPSKHEAAKTVEIRGRVLGPDGQPQAGAKLLLLRKSDKPRQLATTAADGRFALSVPKDAKDSYLIAQVEGLGIDFFHFPIGDPKKPVEFRLVKDRPIRGQVVNTEGKPVSGVHVAVDNLGVYPNNSLDPFLAVWKKQQNVNSGLPNGEKHIWKRAGALLAATTDAGGQFTIPQVGDERLVSLRLSEGGIADMELWVVNRPDFDPKPYNEAVVNNSDPRAIKAFGIRWHLYGPGASIVAETGKIIRGIVKDADSGKGRPGVRVRLTRQNNSDLVRTIPEAITDAKGRYEIRGAHKAKRYMLEIASDPVAGYMPCQIWAEDTLGYDPVTADILVKKGVIIIGKVIDQATGKSVPGWAMAAVLSGNTSVKDYPQFGSSAFAAGGERTAEDDVFRVVTIPGPVLLMGGRGPDTEYRPGGNIETLQYKPSSADADYPQYFHKYPNHTAYHGYSGSHPLSGNFCKVLEIKPGVAVVNQDIVLGRASAVALRIQDAEGQPLAGAWVTGISHEKWEHPVLIEGDTCPAFEVEPGKPRLMIFYQPAKKLIGTRTLRGDEKQPVVVKLRSGGVLKGRLLDADGKPMAGVVVDVRYRDREAEEMDRWVIHERKQGVTDAQGAFTLDELVPELKFELAFRRGTRRFKRQTKPADPSVQLKPGECRDLGDMRMNAQQ